MTDTTDTRTVALLMLRGARWFVLWLMSLQLVAVVAAAIVNAIVNDPVTMAVWQWPAVFWIRYPLVGVGAMIGTVSLGVFVANGVTRHRYLVGSAVFAACIPVITAGMAVVGFALERLVYAVGGVDTQLSDQQPLKFGLVYLLLLASYLASGVMIGGGFARWHHQKAAWFVTPFVIPLVAGELVLGTWWGGVENGELRDNVPLALGAPLMLAVIVVAGVVAHRLLRDVAIRPRKG